MDRSDFEDQYIVTYGWMIELDLEKTEQTILSLVFGYQVSGRIYRVGDGRHLAKWTRKTIPEVIDALKKLQSKGLIKAYEEENGIYLVAQDPRFIDLLED